MSARDMINRLNDGETIRIPMNQFEILALANGGMDKRWIYSMGEGSFEISKRPTIVCLCGSTRFIDAFQIAEFNETLAGRIVLTIGCDTKGDAELFSGEKGERIKEMLDRLHKRKIDVADEILVLNVGGYVGSSTKSEIGYALKHKKGIRWLEPESADAIMASLENQTVPPQTETIGEAA